jgi:tetratricopeptide (TPR) repeat protein
MARALAPALLLLILGCRSMPAPDPVYAPTRDALEVVSLLRLHIDDDTYRFAPARDFTGKNVYRTSLVRLESLEEIHAEKFASGYMLDVIWFAKGRALERLGEFELAARHYARTADLDSPLARDAARGRRICEELAQARSTLPGPTDEPQQALDLFDARSSRLESLRSQVEGTHYEHVLTEEIERADLARTEYFAARSQLDARLDAFALREHQELVQRHRESKLQVRHLLGLADFYAELGRRYARRIPPTTLDFDPAIFDEYAFGATRIYEAVSHRDGAVEKLEAARKLEAFLAFTLQVYDERVPN